MLLVEQFERLHARQIPVYWATGRVDAATRWTDILHLPPNVHLTTGRRSSIGSSRREGRLRAEIMGGTADEQHIIQPTDFRPSAGSVAIALAHGRLAAPVVAAQGVHYWALGGSHRRRVARARRCRSCIIPARRRGARRGEPGPHGCTLVQVDDAHTLRTRFLPTDLLRWHTETIRLDAHMGRADLERLIDQRAHALAGHAGVSRIGWSAGGFKRRRRLGGQTAARRGGRAACSVICAASLAIGTAGSIALSLDIQPPTRLPDDWWQEETIRANSCGPCAASSADGRMRRDLAAQRFRAGNCPSAGRGAVAVDDAATRERVLAQATLLGVDLLSGEEPQRENHSTADRSVWRLERPGNRPAGRAARRVLRRERGGQNHPDAVRPHGLVRFFAGPAAIATSRTGMAARRAAR